jgi:polar amino acid transport system substrate-binding protein
MTLQAPTELAPGEDLRVGINLGNPVIAQRDPAGGDPGGVGPALGRELARRIGKPVRFMKYETAGLMADAVNHGEWDVAFLAVDPARATDIAFTEPYVLIEGAYMVREASPLRTNADVDREGIRLAVGLKTAYDLYLSRTIQRATLVRGTSSKDAIERFLAENLDVVAGVRQPLQAAAGAHGGLRVFRESFMAIRQAAGVPKARTHAAAYLADFIEDMKASGFVARALAQGGQGDVTIAPPRAG